VQFALIDGDIIVQIQLISSVRPKVLGPDKDTSSAPAGYSGVSNMPATPSAEIDAAKLDNAEREHQCRCGDSLHIGVIVGTASLVL